MAGGALHFERLVLPLRMTFGAIDSLMLALKREATMAIVVKDELLET